MGTKTPVIRLSLTGQEKHTKLAMLEVASTQTTITCNGILVEKKNNLCTLGTVGRNVFVLLFYSCLAVLPTALYTKT